MFYRPQRNVDIDIWKEVFSEIIIPDILKSNKLSKKEGTGTFSIFNILVLWIMKQISEIKKRLRFQGGVVSSEVWTSELFFLSNENNIFLRLNIFQLLYIYANQ